MLVVEGVDLRQITYSATLDGEPLDITLPDGPQDRLLFTVPDLAPGSHELALEVGDRSGSITLNAASAPDISDPEAYVEQALGEVRGALLALAGSSEPGVRAVLENAEQELSGLAPQVAELTVEEQLQVARFLNALLSEVPVSGAAVAFDPTRCEAMQSAFKRQLAITIASAAGVLIGGGSAPTIVGGLLGGMSFGIFLIYIDKLKATELEMADVCLTEVTHSIVEGSASSHGLSALSAGGGGAAAVAFDHGVTRTFDVMVEARLVDEALGLVRSITDSFSSLLQNDWARALLPDPWVSYLTVERPAEVSDLAEPSRFSVSGISHSGIAGSAAAEAGRLALSFMLEEGDVPDEPIPFSFQLDDSMLPGASSTIDATLEVSCANAWDAQTLFPGEWIKWVYYHESDGGGLISKALMKYEADGTWWIERVWIQAQGSWYTTNETGTWSYDCLNNEIVTPSDFAGSDYVFWVDPASPDHFSGTTDSQSRRVELTRGWESSAP